MSNGTKNDFIKIPRDLWKDEYCTLSVTAKWLYICLNELEQRFNNQVEGKYFYHSDQQLCDITGMSINVVKRAKKELRRYAMGLVYMDTNPPKKKDDNKFRSTIFRLLR